jgi:hypothetical protein
MRRITTTVASLLIGLLVALTGASSAFARSPWWRLTSGSRPTNLQRGLARDEVQKLTITATSGKVPLEHVIIELGTVVGEASVKFNATPGEVQTALEGIYGTGNVQVTGANPYEITFTGELADQVIRPIVVGGAKQATVTELTAGRADGEIVVTADNLGEASVDGSTTPLQLKDVLPAGLIPVGISGTIPRREFINKREFLSCSLKALSCELPGMLAPSAQLEVRIAVVVQPGASSGEQNVVSASGGEAPDAQIKRAITVSSVPTPFGVEDHELTPEEEGGAPALQAGSHPFQLTDTFVLNQTADAAPLDERPELGVPALVKDLSFNWPPGLIGNPNAVPRCTLAQFNSIVGIIPESLCPPQAAVGVAAVTVYEPAGFKTLTFTVPLFNLEPAVGEPARFGFYVPTANVSVVIDPSVRTGGDYGITVKTQNINETAALVSSVVSVWGVPGDPRHDRSRGWGCIYEAAGIPGAERSPCVASEAQHPPPFLSLPTSCTGPMPTTVEGDSWADPLPADPLLSEYEIGGLGGCNRLPFSPEIKVSPDGQRASTPSGLTVDVHVPQEGVLNPAGLADSNIKDIAVTLPEGMTLNPAAADGLQACSEGLVGFEGFRELETEPGVSNAIFKPTPKLPEAMEPGLNSCPNAAKVGTAKITSPLLPPGQYVTGAVYLAAPAPNEEEGQNPFKTLVAMYIVAEDPVSGTLVKLPGKVTLDQQTGRISASFEDTPQLAFEDAEIHFFGGERAPLSTPAHCGTYTTEATFTPWSASPPVKSTSSFEITSGPNGAPCPSSSLPFAPSLDALMTDPKAGEFSPLSTTISRADGNQDLQTVQLHMPPGLSGILAGIPLCPEAQANAGTCGPQSQIGETIVSVGLGGDPYTVAGGKVYLTEKYQGAPFGLSIVNPADAGPFHLGKVVVRARIEIDPRTVALTITTGAIPHILKGIPLQIKHVNVTIDRPGFTFNPTNCSPMAITGTIGSVQGASSPVSEHFEVTNCAALKFEPKFQVSTSGKSSKAKGASLTVKLSYPAGSQGTEANIARVKVELPKQLPSQLKTLQKACLAAVFEANPASCPAESIVGHATVHTPLLPVPLEGPAYFVSHGGEEFPDLTLVLQGYGVTVELVGSTFISKAGITSSTFKATPDVPFNTFELTLPQGKYSALTTYSHATAGGSLCGQSLTMPTEFRAQNGAEIHQSTPISVTGCPAAITVVRQRVKGKTATIQVRVPGAGKLVATAKGLSKASKTAKGATILTLKLTLTNAEAAFLGKHKGRKLKATVNLQFTPKRGGKLKTSTTVILG